MKVEHQPAVTGVSSSKSRDFEHQATLLVRVLRKASEEIHQASLEAKMSSSDALAQEESPHSNKTPSKAKKSNEQKLLESFIASLNMDLQVYQLTQETVKTLLTKSKQLLKDFANLENQMDTIAKKLNVMMTKEEISAAREQVKEWIEQATEAFAKEKEALEDHSGGEEAKRRLSQAQDAIERVINQVQDFRVQFPDFNVEGLDFIESLNSRGSVLQAGEKLLEKLDRLQLERESLENELAQVIDYQKVLLIELVEVARNLKGTLDLIHGAKSVESSEKELKELLENVVRVLSKSREKKNELEDQEADRAVRNSFRLV